MHGNVWEGPASKRKELCDPWEYGVGRAAFTYVHWSEACKCRGHGNVCAHVYMQVCICVQAFACGTCARVCSHCWQFYGCYQCTL